MEAKEQLEIEVRRTGHLRSWKEVVKIIDSEKDYHVPPLVFLDIYYGVLQEQDSKFLKYKDHINTCQACNDTFRRYHRKDPLTNLSKALEDFDFGGYEIAEKSFGDVEEARMAFFECLSSVSGHLSVVAGEFNWRVYTPAFVEKVKMLLDKNQLSEPLSMLGGPTVSTDENRKSVIPELAAIGRIGIYPSSRRQKDHFRVTEGIAYVERNHPLNFHGTRDSIYYYSDLASSIFSRRFGVLLEEGGIVRTADPQNDFIYLKDDEIRVLQTHVKKMNKSIDHLVKDEILYHLSEIGIHY